MTALLKEARGSFDPLRQKLLRLGVCENDLRVILSRIRLGLRVERGDDILAPGSSPKHLTLLIDGIACLYEMLKDGSRQIYTFQYSGDFCDLSRHALEAPGVGVAAITDCSIGFVELSVLEQLIDQYPSLGTALWRVSMLEACTLRARLLGSRQTALQRVAHFLCEQLVRQQAADIHDAVIPINQIDLADAVGLSVVHVNRTFKELQGLGLLSKAGRSMKVTDREQLAKLGGFDGGYLNTPQRLSGWHVKF